MQISKRMLIPMAAIAVIGAGALGVAKVSATSDTNNPQASLVQKLADTFHIDKTKVQAVFDQNQAQKQADREAQYEDRLTKAVTDGKLTSAQKDLVLTEHKKLQTEMDADRAAGTSSTTRADRRLAMDKIRTEITDWAKANNIDAKWLMGGSGMGGHRGMGDDSDSANPSPSASPAASVN
jgi:hypothetical protein